MSRFIADPSFHLSAQALAVLAMLSQSECDELAAYDERLREYRIEIQTWPWYNGRERGVCLEVRPSFTSNRALLIAFGEHRSSDSIFVDAWEVNERWMNGPTIADFPQEAYASRRHIPYGHVDEAVTIIRDAIQAFMTAANAREETTVGAENPARVAARILPDLGDEPHGALLGRLLDAGAQPSTPTTDPRAYVSIPADGRVTNGTSLQGEINVSFARIYTAFGRPAYSGRATDGGDGKVSTEWIFRDAKTNEVFTLYDYKSTRLYSRDLPTVKQFRAQASAEWHVGGTNKASAARFIAWLETQV